MDGVANSSTAQAQECKRRVIVMTIRTKIENALDKLLTAVLRERAEQPPREPNKPLLLSSFEFSAKLRRSLIEDDNPVEIACLLAIKQLGQWLFDAVGNTDEMRDSLERICARHSETYGRRVGILDAWWNGVGSDNDRWWS